MGWWNIHVSGKRIRMFQTTNQKANDSPWFTSGTHWIYPLVMTRIQNLQHWSHVPIEIIDLLIYPLNLVIFHKCLPEGSDEESGICSQHSALFSAQHARPEELILDGYPMYDRISRNCLKFFYHLQQEFENHSFCCCKWPRASNDSNDRWGHPFSNAKWMGKL